MSILPFLGFAFIRIALASAVWLVVAGLRTARSKTPRPGRPLLLPTAGMLVGASGAIASLVAALLADDFSIRYVAENHARSTPFPFDVATAWAALEGSIVLWGLVLAGYTWSVYRRLGEDEDALGAGALGVLGLVAVFFFGLMATVADPFETVNPIPVDGPGPNPLLQNHLMMAIHPPLLYLGFVGLTVPFAFAISSLWLGSPGRAWLDRTRRWTLVAWSFLTAGILIGGWWSYEVLGWGGFWAWDPVENASFMPWLIATAFIHSAVVQQRRGMLQAWNYSLVISAFAFTILGTFITRSGIIGSVHAFAQSKVGPALLGFLAVTLVGSFGLLAARLTRVAAPPRLDALVSREGAFLVNNLLLTIYTFAVLIGTLYPVLLEAFTGDRVSVGEPFFDRFAVPISYSLLVAMAIGPVTPWRVGRLSVLWDRLRLPLTLAVATGALMVVAGIRLPHVIAVTMLAALVISIAFQQLARQMRARMDRHGESALLAAGRAFRSDPGFWAGQVSHVGVALVAMVIGLYGNLGTTTLVELTPGESTRVDGYELTYIAPASRREPNRDVVGARIEIRRGGRVVEELEPRINSYPNFQQPIGTPAVHTGLRHDLYLTLQSIDQGGITVEVSVFPLMWLLWAGGLSTAAGGMLGLLSRRRRPPRRPAPALEPRDATTPVA